MRREGPGAKENPGQPSLDHPHPQNINTRSLKLRLMPPIPAPFSKSDPSQMLNASLAFQPLEMSINPLEDFQRGAINMLGDWRKR